MVTKEQLADLAEQAGFDEVAAELRRTGGGALFEQIVEAAGLVDTRRITFPTALIRSLLAAAKSLDVRREVLDQIMRRLVGSVPLDPGASNRMSGTVEAIFTELFGVISDAHVAWLEEDKNRIDALVSGVSTIIHELDGKPRTPLYTTAPRESDYVGSIERERFVIPKGEFVHHWPESHWRVVEVLDAEIDQQRHRWSRFDTSSEHTAYSLDYDPRDDIRKQRERQEEHAEQKRLADKDRRDLAMVKTSKQLNEMLAGYSDMHRAFPRLERSEIRQRLAVLEAEEKTAAHDRLRYTADALVPRYVVERRYSGGYGSGSWLAEKFVPFAERDAKIVEIARQWGTRFVAPASTIVRGSPSDSNRWPSDAAWGEIAGSSGVRRIALWFVKGAPVWKYGTSSLHLWVDPTGKRVRTPKEADGPFVEIDGDKPNRFQIPGLPLQDE